MTKTIKNGMRFYDSREGRYLVTNGTGCDPHVWSCTVEELGEAGDYEVVDVCALFHESELRRMEVVA